MLRCLTTVVFAAVFAGALSGCHASSGRAPDETASVPESWEVVCVWLRDQAESLAQDLDASRSVLLARAEAENPALAERLRGPPPTDRPAGWGMLPELRDDGPFTTASPRERRYALAGISVNFASAFRDGRILADRTTQDDETDLESAIKDYERLRGDLDNLLDHLSYHEHWQAQVKRSIAFYAERNELVAAVREWKKLQDAGGDADRIAALDEQVRAGTSRVTAAPGLAIERAEDGAAVLSVTVHTDVDDAAFRQAFLDAIESAWNEAEASRERRFSLRVDLRVHDIDELYPEGAPKVGDPVDLDDHVARFPEGALIMTTGASSTHAWQGRSLLIGTAPTARRTLAHEFGHLLGFDDGYLRGYDGDPDGLLGVVFVEWTGLRDDLMANSAGGRVTADLIDRLIETYEMADDSAGETGDGAAASD